MASIADKFKAMKSDFDLELWRQQNQIDSLSRSIDILIERMQWVENLERPDWEQELAVRTNKESISNPLNDPERTIIASNFKQNQDKDILSFSKQRDTLLQWAV